MPFTLVGESVHYSCPLGAFMATGEQKIFMTSRDRSDRIFNPVVIDLKPAVIHIVAKRIPPFKSIPEGSANRLFGNTLDILLLIHLPNSRTADAVVFGQGFFQS